MTSLKQLSMRGARTLSVVLLLTILTAVASSAAPLWHHVTVVSVENWKYDDVLAQLTEDGDSLIVWLADKSRKAMPRSEIKAIRNFKGEDITRYVYDPNTVDVDSIAPTPALEEREEAQKPYLRGSRFEGIFAFQFGGSVVNGGAYSSQSGGIMLGSSFRGKISPTFHFGLGYSYQMIKNSGRTYSYYSSIANEDYGQHNVTFLFGYHSRTRGYYKPVLMLDLGVGGVASSSSWGGAGDYLALYGSISLIAPTGKTRGFLFEINSRIVNGNSTSGNTFGASIGYCFMKIDRSL